MATTIIWAAPADACLLRALSGAASPTSAGTDAAVATCVTEPQAPKDHSLTRVSRKELATLWAAGACRDENGMPLFGEDGKLVCEFGNSLVQRAAEGLRDRRAHQAREQARPLVHFAPPLPQRPARRPAALVRAEGLRQLSAENLEKRRTKEFQRWEAQMQALVAKAEASAHGLPVPGFLHSPPAPKAHVDVHGEEPPSPARLPAPQTDAEAALFRKLEEEHPTPSAQHHLPPPPAVPPHVPRFFVRSVEGSATARAPQFQKALTRR